MRGQLSAEMLIVLVLVLGLAIFLASTMYKSAEKTGAAIDRKTDNLTKGDVFSLKTEGEACAANSECASGTCSESTGKCLT